MALGLAGTEVLSVTTASCVAVVIGQIVSGIVAAIGRVVSPSPQVGLREHNRLRPRWGPCPAQLGKTSYSVVNVRRNHCDSFSMARVRHRVNGRAVAIRQAWGSQPIASSTNVLAVQAVVQMY